ncbi:MAG: hypothetical protein O2827_01615 [Verrucomicrobia bacterium]|nr:hypothetical protein [Verrucomicrobiota bacterium]
MNFREKVFAESTREYRRKVPKRGSEGLSMQCTIVARGIEEVQYDPDKKEFRAITLKAYGRVVGA